MWQITMPLETHTAKASMARLAESRSSVIMSMKTTHPFAWVLKACYTAEISLYCRGVLLSMRGSGLVLPYGAAFVGPPTDHNYM